MTKYGVFRTLSEAKAKLSERNNRVHCAGERFTTKRIDTIAMLTAGLRLSFGTSGLEIATLSNYM